MPPGYRRMLSKRRRCRRLPGTNGRDAAVSACAACGVAPIVESFTAIAAAAAREDTPASDAARQQRPLSRPRHWGGAAARSARIANTDRAGSARTADGG